MSAAAQADSAPLIERSHHIMVFTSNVVEREGMALALVTHLSHYGAGFKLNLEQDSTEIVITHAGAKARSAGIELPIDPHEAKQILEDLRMHLRKYRAEFSLALALVDSAVRAWVTDVVHDISAEPELTIVTDGPHGAIKKIEASLPGRAPDRMTLARYLDGSYHAQARPGLAIDEPVAGQALQWILEHHRPRLSAGLRQAIEDVYGVLADQWAALNPDDPEDDDLDDEADEQLEELAAATLEAAEVAQASIIDAPNEAAPVRNIPTAWLTLDERCQPRTGIDEATVQRYIEALREGVTLPPIEVVASRAEQPIWVVDGWHRTIAHRRVGSSTIQAVRHVGELRDAIWRATSANATNGLQRSQADLARAIAILLDDPEWAQMSDRALAKHVGCSDKTIGNHKRRRAQEDQEAAAKAEDRQEAPAAPTAEIRTPAETTRHETIERTTTTAAPERCEHTLDLVGMLAPPVVEAPKSTIMSDEDMRRLRNDRELERIAQLVAIGYDLTVNTPCTVDGQDLIRVTLTMPRQNG
jgi:hypothetical protein